MTVGVGETHGVTEPEGALARPVLRRALAVIVVAAWVAWSVPFWTSSLQEVRPHEFVADVRAGRVTGFQVVANVRSETLRWSSLGTSWQADVPAADTEGRPIDGPPRQLVYSVDGGVRTRWLPDAVPVVGELDPFIALSASGARPFTPETLPPNRDWAAYPALLALAIALFSVVMLPPTRGTRPFWVLAGTLTAGLGILAYAVLELWWRRPATAVTGLGETDADGRTDAVDGDDRLCWWHGAVVRIVGGLVVSALVPVIT